jgi:hypothetical protein
MRRPFVVTAMVCLMMCFALAMTGQTTLFKFVQDGEFGSLSQSTGLSGFSVKVSRGLTTSSGASASLQYSAFSIAADGSSISFSNAFGPIPPANFTGQNVQNLALNIDTSTLDPSVFFSQSCTLLLVSPFTLTCGTGPAGVINLQFTENDAQSTVIHSQEEVTNGPVTTRTNQRSDNSTATVQGSVFGASVNASAFATVGVSHMSSIEIVHN